MLGQPQGTHCKSGCGLTPWYLKHENYKLYYMLQYAEQFCNFCMNMIFRGWGGPLDTTVQLRHNLDYPQHRPQRELLPWLRGDRRHWVLATSFYTNLGLNIHDCRYVIYSYPEAKNMNFLRLHSQSHGTVGGCLLESGCSSSYPLQHRNYRMIQFYTNGATN